MADVQQQFLDLLRDYMKSPAPDQKLFKFIDSPQLKFEDVRACASSYFNLDKDAQYTHERTKWSGVFLKLASALLEKGDVYFALRLDVMVGTTGLTWEIHYKALSPKDRSTLQARITRKKLSLSSAERQFMNMFDLYMKKQTTQQEIQKFTDKLNRDGRRGCLSTYVEVSQRYADRNKYNSLLIFYGLSTYAIRANDAYFAHIYEGKVAERDSPWGERYQALSQNEDWRKDIERDIAEKKTISTDVKIKVKEKEKDKKTGEVKETEKEKLVKVPTGHYKFAPVAPEKTYREDREKTEAPTEAPEEFRRLYQRYVVLGERAAEKDLHNFLRVRQFKDLQACITAYLSDDTYRATDSNPRSLIMFFAVLSTALAKEKDSAYYALKVRLLINTPNTIWNKKFMAMDKTLYRHPLEVQIEQEIQKKARLIDEVKAAYFAQRQTDPDRQALATFEPKAGQEQENLVSSALSDCEVGIGAGSLESFETGFDSLAKVLTEQHDSLVLLAMIRRCRDRPGLDKKFRDLFYLYGVGLLFGNVLRQRPVIYQKGFNDEELTWLIAGSDTGNRYFSDFALQLSYAMWKRAGHPTLTALCKGEALLHIYAEKFRLFLTPTLEAAALLGEVERLWEKNEKEVAALRIPIMSRRDGKQELRVAQMIGNFFILWWDFRRGIVYLHVKGFDKVVFETRQERLAEIYDDDAIYGAIFRNTQHILEFMPIFWQVIMYIPDLVSGGLMGLAKSIVFNYAFEASTEALGIDPTQAQAFLFGVGLLAHGLMPHEGGPKGEAGIAAAEKDIARDARAVASHNQMVDARVTAPVGADAALPHGEPHIALDTHTTGSTAGIGDYHAQTGPRGLGADPPGPPGPPGGGHDVGGLKPDSGPRGIGGEPPGPPLESRTGFDPRGPERPGGEHEIGGWSERPDKDVEGGSTGHSMESRSGFDPRGPEGPEGGRIVGGYPQGQRRRIEAPKRERASGTPGDEPGGTAARADARANKAKSRATGDRGADVRDRSTEAPHDDPNASRGTTDKGTKEPEVRQIVSGQKTTRLKAKPMKGGEHPQPHNRDRMPDKGTWSKLGEEGEINLNEGGHTITKEPADFREFEQAVNQQVVPQYAQGVSNKPVKKVGPHDPGYHDRPVTQENWLKLQRRLTEVGNPLTRVPDGTMIDVNIPIGGKKSSTTDVQLFETTMQTDFPVAQHKQTQTTGTVWLLGEGRKNFGPDTRVHYNFFAPGLPSKATVEFLEKKLLQPARDANINLEINWIVVEPRRGRTGFDPRGPERPGSVHEIGGWPELPP
jgi:hypothetical protein